MLKLLVRAFISGVVIAFLIMAPFTLFNKINELNYSINSQYEFTNSQILELWNIDTFEGGSVPRSLWLERRAIEFEKQNKGVYIVVRNMTPEQLELNLNSNNKPSLICFGIGVGELFYDKLLTLNKTYNVKSELLNAGKINNKQKAIPLMMGGYLLISNGNLVDKTDNLLKEFNNFSVNKKANLGYGNFEYITPLLSLYCNEIYEIKNNFEDSNNISSFDAYDKFINNKFTTLLGTQRDYYRCKNRESNLKMQNNSYYFLENFSDLVQYISVFNSDSLTNDICESFIDFLLTEKTQSTLTDIKMFSVLEKNFYTNEYGEYNMALNKPLKTLSVFLAKEKLNDLKNLLNGFYFNKENNKNLIEKFLID